MSDETIDFDAYWQEYSDTAPRQTFIFLGEKVPLPFDLPLAIERKIQAANFSKEEELAALIKGVYGTDLLSNWLNKGIGARQMIVLLSWTMLRLQGSKMTPLEVAREMDKAFAEGKVKIPLNNSGPR
ncbi:MAG: hypothetical protein LC778_10240 [Acidobacteria bacterium]|nr:hypothetical protein [Acidobacteriota bacterium]